MGWESTITELDLAAATLHFVNCLVMDKHVFERDLAVDGLSESTLSRLF
jgi:hypothetical protein